MRCEAAIMHLPAAGLLPDDNFDMGLIEPSARSEFARTGAPSCQEVADSTVDYIRAVILHPVTRVLHVLHPQVRHHLE